LPLLPEQQGWNKFATWQKKRERRIRTGFAILLLSPQKACFKNNNLLRMKQRIPLRKIFTDPQLDRHYFGIGRYRTGLNTVLQATAHQ